MRINYSTFKKVAKEFGEDFQVQYDVPSHDKFNLFEEYIMLRFGYWAEVDLVKLEEIFNIYDYKVEVNEFEDDDCGWLYSYYIKKK